MTVTCARSPSLGVSSSDLAGSELPRLGVYSLDLERGMTILGSNTVVVVMEVSMVTEVMAVVMVTKAIECLGRSCDGSGGWWCQMRCALVVMA